MAPLPAISSSACLPTSSCSTPRQDRSVLAGKPAHRISQFPFRPSAAAIGTLRHGPSAPERPVGHGTRRWRAGEANRCPPTTRRERRFGIRLVPLVQRRADARCNCPKLRRWISVTEFRNPFDICALSIHEMDRSCSSNIQRRINHKLNQ